MAALSKSQVICLVCEETCVSHFISVQAPGAHLMCCTESLLNTLHLINACVCEYGRSALGRAGAAFFFANEATCSSFPDLTGFSLSSLQVGGQLDLIYWILSSGVIAA